VKTVPSVSAADAFPLVSILIPAYNHSQYILECLNSVLQEGYPNLEILVIDDGSQDDTYQVAKQWADANIRAFSNIEIVKQYNRGVTKTLNSLILKSRGEYIVLLASDDALVAGGIMTRVQMLQRRQDLLAVFGDCVVINNDSKEIAESALRTLYRANINALKLDKALGRELILRWSVPGPGLLIRRVAYDTALGVGLYNEDLKIEDRDFYLRLINRKALGFIDLRVAKYRIHDTNSITNPTRSVNFLSDGLKAEQLNIRLSKGVYKFLLNIVIFKSSALLNAKLKNDVFSKIKANASKALIRIVYLIHSFVVTLSR
jgi:glycosyltransferase involved in cell wall biosynthesis